MADSKQDRNRIFGIDLWATVAAFVLALLMIVLATQLHAQTFTVLHNFTSGLDGGGPIAGLTMDVAGNLYGTTDEGGSKSGNCYANGCGTVFKIKRVGSSWIFVPLYLFQGQADGRNPTAPVTLGKDGSLYSTASGSSTTGCGVVFNLKPPPAACTASLCFWSESVVYSFHGYDGCGAYSGVIYDQAGNLYGTTVNGGEGNGTVYELSPSNGSWTESVLHAFTYSDGAYPAYGGVVFDAAGNLYGTTADGGDRSCVAPLGCGVVFQLTPSGSGWTDSTLYKFENGSDGAFPEGGVVLDSSGNLYGGNTYGGPGGGGAIYELSPSNGSWTLNVLYNIITNQQSGGNWSSLVMDKAGNLYGTTRGGGVFGTGNVFKLTPNNGGWTYTSVHDFYCATDGCGPYGSVLIDAAGNLYGTAGGGGAHSFGTVWEITP